MAKRRPSKTTKQVIQAKNDNAKASSRLLSRVSVAMYFTTWALTDLLSVVVVAFGLHAVQPDLPWWLVVPAISSLVLLRRWIENRLTSENKKHRWAWKIFYALVFITMAGLGIAGMFWLIQAIPTLVS
jgi:hypothetical protein